MAVGRKKRHKPMAEINVVPYIDVMLVLLIIFMITAPLLSQGVKVDLPKAKATTLSAQQKGPIIVSVDASGNYFLNTDRNPSKPIAAGALVADVAAKLKVDPKRDVLVKGDNKVDYGKVVQAMVLLQNAGAPTVGLMTQEPDK